MIPVDSIWYDRKYMIADALEFWLSRSFWNSNEINNFQEELIFKGKIMYLSAINLSLKKN